MKVGRLVSQSSESAADNKVDYKYLLTVERLLSCGLNLIILYMHGIGCERIYMYTWTLKSSKAPSNILSYSVIEKANSLLHNGIAIWNAESTTTVHLFFSKLEREDYIREPELQSYPIPGPPTLPSFPLSVSPLGEFLASPRLLSTLLFLFLRIAKQGVSGGGLGSDTGDVSQSKKSVPVKEPGPVSQCHKESGMKGSGWGPAVSSSTASPGGFWQLIQFPVAYIHYIQRGFQLFFFFTTVYYGVF